MALADWQRLGVWQKVHELMLCHLRAADMIDFSRVIADSSSMRAVHGEKKRAPARWIGASPAPSITF